MGKNPEQASDFLTWPGSPAGRTEAAPRDLPGTCRGPAGDLPGTENVLSMPGVMLQAGMSDNFPAPSDEKKYAKEKGVFSNLEKELSLGPGKRAEKSIEELAAELEESGAGKLKSPQISAGEEEEGAEAQEDEAKRRMLILRIREIMVSNARDRAEQLRTLLSQAPKGMETMMHDIIQKYTSVLNEPGPQLEEVKVHTQTGTLFEPYSAGPRDEGKDSYQGGPSEPSRLYSGGSRETEDRQFRPGMDTGADTAVKKMMERYRQEEGPEKAGYGEGA